MTTTTADPATKAQHASIVQVALDISKTGDTNFTTLIKRLFLDATEGPWKHRAKAAELLIPLLTPHASKIIDIEEAARAAGKTIEGTAWNPSVTYVELAAGVTPERLKDSSRDDEDDEP